MAGTAVAVAQFLRLLLLRKEQTLTCCPGKPL